MSFLGIVSANSLSIIITMLFLLWMSGILLGRIPNRGIKHAVTSILFTLFLTALLSTVSTAVLLQRSATGQVSGVCLIASANLHGGTLILYVRRCCCAWYTEHPFGIAA